MVAILEKSDAAEGFEQIIDFLSGSYINHALTMNPHVYISCIKKFWNTAVVKRSGDITRLQALVDKKRIVITEEVVREILQLNDAEGVETPLFESMLAVKDVAEEAEEHVLAQGNDVQEPTTEEVATNVVPPTPTSPSPSSLILPSSPPHQPPCPPQPQDAESLSLLFQRVLDTCSALALRVEGLGNDKAAQQLEIVKLKARVKKLETIHKVKSSKLRQLKKVGTYQRVEYSDDVENVFNQGRIIVDMDQDEGIELVADQEKDAKVEGMHADKQAEIYNIDLDHSLKVLSMQEDDTEVQEAVEILTTAKLMTEVVTAAATQVAAVSTPIPTAKPKTLTITAAPAVSTRRRKGVVIRDPKEELHSDTPAETPKVKEKGKGILIEAPKPMKKKDQIEMDAEEEMEKEDIEIIKSINETPAQKATKRRKLSKEAQEADDLRKRLEIVQDKDDDVFFEATLLAQKVPVMDYQIVVIDNKPKRWGMDCFLSGNNSSGTKKYRGSNSGDGGNTGDGVKITARVIGFGGGIVWKVRGKRILNTGSWMVGRRHSSINKPAKIYWEILPKEILGSITQRDTGSYYPKSYWELLTNEILRAITQRDTGIYLPKEILGAITQRDTGSYYPKRYFHVGASSRRYTNNGTGRYLGNNNIKIAYS
nr:hypothetical protein [Tanacetum cinerariifolium]